VEFQNSGAEVGHTVMFQVSLSEKGQPRAIDVQPIGAVAVGHGAAAAHVPAAAAALAYVPTGIQKTSLAMRGNLSQGMPIKRPPTAGAGAGNRGNANMPQRLFGQIRTFNQEKGFGFIQSDQSQRLHGQADVFLHYTQAINFRVGDFVTFELTFTDAGKPQAKNLIQSNDSAPPVIGPPGGMNANMYGAVPPAAPPQQQNGAGAGRGAPGRGGGGARGEFEY